MNDLKTLLEQLAGVTDVDRDANLALTDPSQLKAQKKQELPNLPQDDMDSLLRDLDSVKYGDPERFMKQHGEMIVGSAQPLNTARLVERGLDKLRGLPGAESKIGQFVEENIRQPLKRNLNVEDFTKLGQETADDVAKEAAARQIRQAELEKYLQRPEVKQTAEEALMNRNYNPGTQVINPSESTSIIDPSLEITKQIEALLGKAK